MRCVISGIGFENEAFRLDVDVDRGSVGVVVAYLFTCSVIHG